MSRGYRIRWPQPVWHNASKTVESSDAIAMDVGMLDILPEGDMVAILREQLAAAGWQRCEDGAMRTTVGGVEVELDAEGRKVRASSSAQRKVAVRSQQEGELREQLGRASEGAERELSREVARQIISAEAEIRERIQGALQKVYIEALQRKAASMGEIESIISGVGEDGELEMTIKVKV